MKSTPLRERLVQQLRRFLMPPPVSRIELREILEGPRADTIVIDTRSRADFRGGHLPGAINVPGGAEFAVGVLRAVPEKGCRVVLYCQNHRCSSAYDAARIMELLGYLNVSVYEEGHDGWHADGEERIESPAGAPPHHSAACPPAAATDSC